MKCFSDVDVMTLFGNNNTITVMHENSFWIAKVLTGAWITVMLKDHV